MDAFARLGLPRRFDLDRATIERAYLSLAGAAHPDALGTPGLSDDPSDAASSDLNRARQDLLDPESRASLLLALLGGPSKESDRSLPDGFLMEMMEVREQMEAAAAARDAAALERWRNWAEDQRIGYARSVGELFKQVERDGPRPEILKAIRTRLNAWRYIERMLEQIAEV
jgi:molecular chaperone HscB